VFAAVAKSIFGSANDRYVRSLGKYVDAVNGFEPNISALSDDELKGQTEIFRQRLARGEKLGAWALTEPDAGSDAAGTRTTADHPPSTGNTAHAGYEAAIRRSVDRFPVRRAEICSLMRGASCSNSGVARCTGLATDR